MPRYRISELAKADIAAILRRSEELHGREASVRYRACLIVAMRRVAAQPHGHATIDHAEIVADVRSFHVRHSRNDSREVPVANPVHVIFYRVAQPGMIEIVRVLHERMEPTRHIGPMRVVGGG